MNQDKLLVTSSDNIPYEEIDQQYGIVDSQIVVGANIFRDAFAGFRDLFGGETKGYKKDIDKMKAAALSNIKSQAKEKGANAIISLKIDLDELSGGNKSMFMMNVYGSAVKLKQSALESTAESSDIAELSFEEINYFKKRSKLKSKIDKVDNIIREIDLKLLSEYSLWEKEIVKKVLNDYENSHSHIREKFQEHIDEIPLQFIEEYLSNNFDEIKRSLWDRIYNTFESRNWFNYDFLKTNLKDQNHIKRFRALQLCNIEKNLYEKEDANQHQELAHFISNDFDSTIPTEIVTKMINKKEVYICPNCLKQTDTSRSYCECGANNLGLEPVDLTIESISNDLLETAKAIEMAFKDIN